MNVRILNMVYFKLVWIVNFIRYFVREKRIRDKDKVVEIWRKIELELLGKINDF